MRKSLFYLLALVCAIALDYLSRGIIPINFEKRENIVPYKNSLSQDNDAGVLTLSKLKTGINTFPHNNVPPDYLLAHDDYKHQLGENVSKHN